MTTVTFDLDLPGSQPVAYRTILVQLVAGTEGGATGPTVIGDTRPVKLDEDGQGEIDLVRNDEITPSGTYYRLTVAASSPTLVRCIRLESDTTVAWTDEAIQVVEAPVGASYVPSPTGAPDGYTLTIDGEQYVLGPDSGGGGPVVADGILLLIDTDAVDGTATELTNLGVEATDAGITFPSLTPGTLPTEAWAEFLGSQDPNEVRLGVPEGPHAGVYAIAVENDIALLDQPWTRVEGAVAVKTTNPTWVAIEQTDGSFVTIAPVNPYEVKYVHGGIYGDIDNVAQVLGGIEGYLDNERYVRGYFEAAVDSSLFDGPVADEDQPVTDDGQQVVKGDLVATLGNTEDPFHWIAVVDQATGQWGWVPSTGASTPPAAASWQNAISTNNLVGGSKFVGRAGSIGVFLSYRYDDTLRGGPAPFDGDDPGGVWAISSPGAGGGVTEGQMDTAIAAAVSALVDGAPGALDTLNELAAALGDDASFAASVTTALAGKQAGNANLTALAGLSLVADRVPYANGTGTLALATLTSTARSLLDDSTTADMLTTLGALAATSTRLPTRAALASDTPFSNTTLGDLTGMSISCVAGQTYVLRGRVPVTGGSTGDFKVAFTGTGGLAGTLNVTGWAPSNSVSSFPANVMDQGVVFDTLGTSVGNFGLVAASTTTLVLDGYFTCTTSGTLTLQGAQRATDAGTPTVFKAGSHLIWHTA